MKRSNEPFTVLFIGGSFDGERQTIPGSLPLVFTVAIKPFVSVLKEPPYKALKVETENYHLETVDCETEYFYIYVHSSLTQREALHRLFLNYTPIKDRN